MNPRWFINFFKILAGVLHEKYKENYGNIVSHNIVNEC